MTRRGLPLLAGALLLCGVAAGAPTPALEAVRVQPTPNLIGAAPAHFDVHLGDGIFRLRIRGCETCRASVTIEVTLGELWQLIRSS